MKVLLRSKPTGQYYAGPTAWVANPDAAQGFNAVEDAVELTRSQHLTAVEVVLRYEDPACELVVPVRPDWHPWHPWTGESIRPSAVN